MVEYTDESEAYLEWLKKSQFRDVTEEIIEKLEEAKK
jgi:hypothetical protein